MIVLDLLTTCMGHLLLTDLQTTQIKNQNVLTQSIIALGHLK